jgi:hypothetical protein
MKRRRSTDRRQNRFDRRQIEEVRIREDRLMRKDRRGIGEYRKDWIRFCPYISQYAPKITAEVFSMAVPSMSDYKWVIEKGYYI